MAEMEQGIFEVKVGLAEMLKGGVIMDVTTADQAKIAEDAGAVAVMALERIPADIRADGGIARMSNPQMVRAIQEVVSIPVMAKCRIGHFAEAQILAALEVDFIVQVYARLPYRRGTVQDRRPGRRSPLPRRLVLSWVEFPAGLSWFAALGPF